MMPMPMHYYDAEAEADFRLTNHRGWRRGRPRLDYQDYQSGWHKSLFKKKDEITQSFSKPNFPYTEFMVNSSR